MNMFARFDENPAMPLQILRKQNVTDGGTDARTDGQRENNIPSTNKVCGGIIILRLSDTTNTRNDMVLWPYQNNPSFIRHYQY